MLPILMLLACVVLRLVPHPPNFAPVGATSVFAGRTMRLGSGIVLTLAAMLISDFALGTLKGIPAFSMVTPFIYAGFIVQLLLGRWLRAVRGGAIGAAFLGSVAFFVLSNFGVWLKGSYGLTLGGLAACYVAAIPFFGGTLAGDVVWTVVLSVAYRWIARRVESTNPALIPVPTAQIAAV
jgi:uncharacterized protein DUF6580